MMRAQGTFRPSCEGYGQGPAAMVQMLHAALLVCMLVCWPFTCDAHVASVASTRDQALLLGLSTDRLAVFLSLGFSQGATY